MQKVANPQSSVTAASLTALWTSAASLTLTAPVTFLAELALPTYLHVMYGVPGAVWLNLTVTSAGGVLLEVQLFNKTATRLNEAMYADFATPLGADSASATPADM